MTSPGRLRAMTALWLLMPQTPLFFQGQEFAASSPFLYFNDAGEDAPTVAAGRAKFLSQFPSYGTAEIQAQLPDPAARVPSSVRSSIFPSVKRMPRPTPCIATCCGCDSRFNLGQASGSREVRWGPTHYFRFAPARSDSRLLIVNFGVELRRGSIAHPLVAPPQGRNWKMAWSSENPQYGGNGMPEPISRTGWRLPGESAVLLTAEPAA